MSSPTVAGVDGCRGGWVVVLWNPGTGIWKAQTTSSFGEVLDVTSLCVGVAVDMPIGLHDDPSSLGRECEFQARALLRKKASSIFHSPARPLLAFSSYSDLLAHLSTCFPQAPKPSIQAFHIMRKIAEVDSSLTDYRGREKVREVHPELSFMEMNQGIPVILKKKTREGLDFRRGLLEGNGFSGISERLPEIRKMARAHGAELAADDLVDACAAAWTAARIASGTAIRIPENSPRDARGLPMELWR